MHITRTSIAGARMMFHSTRFSATQHEIHSKNTFQARWLFDDQKQKQPLSTSGAILK